MERILFNKKKEFLDKNKNKITSERQLIIQEFLERLNAERGNYPLITPGRLARLFTKVKNSDLKIFLADCKYAQNFSKYFWFKIK